MENELPQKKILRLEDSRPLPWRELGADPDLLQHIKTILTDIPFPREGYGKVWARLRFPGIRDSKSVVLRLMR